MDMANRRAVRFLCSSHNSFDHFEADNGHNEKTLLVLPICQAITLSIAVAAFSNRDTGIKTLGDYNQQHSFKDCVAKYNRVAAIWLGQRCVRNYRDDFTTFDLFCCARGRSNIIQVNSTDFVMKESTIEDGQVIAPHGRVVSGARPMLSNHPFRSFQKGKDLVYSVAE